MSEAHILTDVDMARGERFELGGGEAVVLSLSKPGRDGPNEDAAAVISLGERAGVAVVSDGAGGHPGGAKAAALAVHAVCDSVMALGDELENLRGAIINGFELADRAISALGTGAAATLAVVEIQGNNMRAYHAGDSMVLVTGQRGRIKWLTIPHSPVGYAVEAGLLDRGEALHHEDLHLVSNLLGTQDMRIELGATVALAPRDTVVLASDGLSDNLHLDEIVDCVRKGPLPQAVDELAALGKKRMEAPAEGAPSKPDDLTFIAIRSRPV
ncbi:MAG: protein phosphatase 2C domain-containing protein [Deltaproteobacteria bacterium]|nr:protein phosphatase 2C domain-containing protein [Deltaproteobacteria bacterium]MBW2189701.1 protein phosphatase 2C domain-containing protein [Deltaproteobacteria bacterium]